MKKYLFAILAVGCLLSITITSCKKDKEDEDQDNQEEQVDTNDVDTTDADNNSADSATAKTNAPDQGMVMMGEDMSIFTYASNSAENGELQSAQKTSASAVPACATVSVEGGIGVWPKIMTIDFGANGDCEGIDGRFRRGKIIAEFSGSWANHNNDDSIKVTLEDYAVNDTIITGTRYYWIEDWVLVDGQLTLGVKVEDASIIYPTGDTGTWAGQGTFTAENVNLDYTDDILTYDFEASGVDRYGNSYGVSTQEAIVSKAECLTSCVFVDGILVVDIETITDTVVGGFDVQATTDLTISLDYGDGECDGTLSASAAWETSYLLNGQADIYPNTTGSREPQTYSCGESLEQ